MSYRPMSEQEVHAFLAALPARTGKLATVRADGSPHVAPVWYDIDDDGSLVFNTGESTVKGRNLARDPRASFCVDDERPPFSFVVVEGAVELSDDPEESFRLFQGRIIDEYEKMIPEFGLTVIDATLPVEIQQAQVRHIARTRLEKAENLRVRP